MGEEVRDNVEGFDCTFGAAGKIDDDGLVANHGHTAGEDSGGSFLYAFAADFFGQAGNCTISDIESGLGSRVARTEPGAAGSEKNIDGVGIGNRTHLAADFGWLIGATQRRSDGPAEFAATGNQSGAGEILSFSAGDGIADGQDGDFQVISSQF